MSTVFVVGTIYGSTNDAKSRATIQRALELDVTMPGSADVYGPFHNEHLVGHCRPARFGSLYRCPGKQKGPRRVLRAFFVVV